MAKPGPGMTMAAAMVHYRAGRLYEAEAICRRLVKRNKRDVNALQMLGTLATRGNRRRRATSRTACRPCRTS